MVEGFVAAATEFHRNRWLGSRFSSYWLHQREKALGHFISDFSASAGVGLLKSLVFVASKLSYGRHDSRLICLGKVIIEGEAKHAVTYVLSNRAVAFLPPEFAAHL